MQAIGDEIAQSNIAPGNSPARILIVDDRPQNLIVLETLLAPLGHPIDKANNATEALRYLLQHDDYAVILLDVQLPDIDGFETATLIKDRQKTRHIPIIFITAISTDIRNVYKGYSSGAVDYIAKPFNPDILKAKVAVFVELYLRGEQIKQQAELLRLSGLREAEARSRETEQALEHQHHIELAAAYAREKRIAEVLQRSLLLAPPECEFAGISVATRYEAAWDEAKLGGDFFDVFLIDPNRVALVLGDVTGKGLQAAAHTAEVKYTLRAFLRESHDPGQAMCRLNRSLLAQWASGSTTFVCLSVLVWDTSMHKILAAGAGGELPLIIRGDGGTESICATGLPLGIDAVDQYDVPEITLGPGDVIVMVTDGITEARCAGALFGREGMVQCLTSLKKRDVQSTAEAILSDARRFAGGRLQDDACLLVARCEGMSTA